MIPAHIRSNGARAGRVAGFLVALAVVGIASCSSDPPSPLGSDNDLTGSTPGVIFEDTLDAYPDTVLQYYSNIATDAVLELGRESGYERAMVIQVSFDGAIADVGKVVDRAVLRITPSTITGSIPARFYQLQEPYAEGDSLPTLDTLSVLVDPDTGSPNRTMQTLPREYPLDPALVRDWIRFDSLRTAIAIVYDDDATDELATFHSSEASADAPTLQINFVGGTFSSYKVTADCTFMRATATTPNLVVSDGDVRRSYFRIPLDSLTERSAIHSARVRLYMVPGSTLGDQSNLIVFIPTTDDVTSDDFLTGQLVTATSFDALDDYVEFGMTNAINLMLQGTLENNGVVVRFDAENSELRQVEFYGSNAADSLRPRILVTSSTPADFHPPGEP
jgi:hypothetical protein